VIKPNPTASVPLDNAEHMQTFKENDWVLVKYDEKTYPGTFTAVVGSEVEVSVIERAGMVWKWPVKAHKIFYTRHNVVQLIDPPELAGTRRQYRFKSLNLLSDARDISCVMHGTSFKTVKAAVIFKLYRILVH